MQALLALQRPDADPQKYRSSHRQIQRSQLFDRPFKRATAVARAEPPDLRPDFTA